MLRPDHSPSQEHLSLHPYRLQLPGRHQPHDYRHGHRLPGQRVPVGLRAQPHEGHCSRRHLGGAEEEEARSARHRHRGRRREERHDGRRVRGHHGADGGLQGGKPAKIAKAQVDKLIDLAAPPPRGTGVENIRECIIESKMTFDVSSDDWQAYLKAKIMNNIERYFYLIVFAMYIREVGPKGFPQTFKQFMDENSGLRTMIEEGRGKPEWERKIPDENLLELKDLLSAADFKANMPKIIKRIYELSWDMFGDLPRGHHKNNSMHKLASKTMIEILPDNLSKHIEAKCGSLASTPDLFDVIGQVSWFEDGSGEAAKA